MSNKNSDSFPARGYVLVDPSTPDAEKLQRRHDRDNTKASLRHVVDWKFVPACVEEHRIIPWDEIPDGDNVFKRGDENRAWSVFVYPSGHHATLLRYAYQLSVCPLQLRSCAQCRTNQFALAARCRTC